MTFKVTILGSSAALPMAGKHHSAHVLNAHEQFYLLDCGEGTQTRLGECGINPLKINAVFITHLHGDHLYGLFPFVATLSLLGRKTPLRIFAPEPLGELMRCMSDLLGEKPAFPIEFHAVNTRENAMIFENKVLEVWTIPLRHRIPAAGYLFREKRPQLNVRKDMIGRYGLGVAQIVAAKRGEDITLDEGNAERADRAYGELTVGKIIVNEKLTYTPYEPRSYAYCTDTMFSGKVASLVAGVDLLYHEATFAASDKSLAKQTGHSTTEQAAKIAAAAGVGRLLIGHFSGRYRDVQQLVDEARAIFPDTDAAMEGKTYEIKPKLYKLL